MQNFDDNTDEEVAHYVQSKDKEAYSVIVERYQNKLLRYVNSIVRDGARASDTVQETFIKAFINLRSFDTKKKFSSWIYRIAHNEALNAIKKNSKEVYFDDDFDFASSENIEEDFEKKEIVTKVSDCMNKMPLLYSEPLVLYAIEEKSYEEISDILRIPMGTVATRISRAKLLMKNICKKN